MLKVYVDPRTGNCRKLLAGLRLLNVSFSQEHIDYVAGEHKRENYRNINPNGTLPAAMHGNTILWESNAILQYAADLGGSNAHYPTDLKRRADIHRWMFWEAGTWAPSNYIIFVENFVKPLLYQFEPDRAVIAKEMPNWHRLANILDERLSRSMWLTGDAVTIADIAVAAPIHMHIEASFPINEHGNIWRWMVEGIEQLPCWKETRPIVNTVPTSSS